MVDVIELLTSDEESNEEVNFNRFVQPNPRRRRRPGRIPTRFREPDLSPIVLNPRDLNLQYNIPKKKKTTYTINYDKPDFIMSARYDETDSKLKFSCGWKFSNEFKWMDANVINSRYPWLVIEYYHRATEYYSSDDDFA